MMNCAGCWCVLCALLLVPAVRAGIGCDCSDLGTVSCDPVTEQCTCKPGVGGLQCDTCLPGYTDLDTDGCRLQCAPRASGAQCDTCSFGYRDISVGCTPCPACFDQVVVQYDQTLDLYNQLLTQLNFTLESEEMGGVNAVLLARAQEYMRTLEDLLQRAMDASASEEDLFSEYSGFESFASFLGNLTHDFILNLTTAESAFDELQDRLQVTQSSYTDLSVGVAVLERAVREELSQLLQEAMRLNQEIWSQISELVEVSTRTQVLSSLLQSEASLLLEGVSVSLQNASSALQRLRDTIVLQGRLQAALEVANSDLLALELLAEEAEETLEEAAMDVPIAAMEATRVLAAILDISLEDFDLDFDPRSKGMEVDDIEEEITRESASVDIANRFLSSIRENSTSLNSSAAEILTRSQELNDEARLLLDRSIAAFSLANASAVLGNLVIDDAAMLIFELEIAFGTVMNFSNGLEAVIRNLEMAERQSLEAEQAAEQAEEDLGSVARSVNASAALLEDVSAMLNETLALAIQTNNRVNLILSNATSLNSSSAELAVEVVTATGEVDRLEEAAMDDERAISTLTCTANDTILLGEDILQRITVINATILNLTLELNQTELIPPERLQEVAGELAALEGVAADNQVLVDMLSSEIERLQRSATELRNRYTMLRQHRDLLQEILNNVEALDCRDQFVSN